MEKSVNYTPADKIAEWFKRNLENFVLLIVCGIYIFRGIADIDRTGKTVLGIIADGAIAFIGGYVIKAIMDKKGVLRGLIANKFVATTNIYANKKTDISGFVEELTPFCDKSNAERLKQKQKEYLLNYAMSYDLFIQGFYDRDKEKRKIAEQCRQIKVFEYTPVMLTNAYDNAKSEEELLTATIGKYERKQRFGDALIGIITFLLFGYFGFKPGTWIWANIAWASLQVGLFLANGMIKYMNAYFFVTETLRGKIKRVVDILDEFINIRAKHPGIFKVSYIPEEIPPVKDNHLTDDIAIDRMTQLNDKINALS